MKTIAILGSTGSIGTNTLDIVERFPDKFRVAGLTACSNDEKLEDQIRLFKPRVVALSDASAAARLRRRCANLPVDILAGEEGLIQVATTPEVELVISAIVGGAGLVPTLAGIRSRKHIALANKEPMVMAGKLMQDEARRHGVRILPVDSEHSAIFQSLEGHRIEDVRRLILTASGGALWTVGREELTDVTPERALQHPNWKMGAKITIDSATLMNKGLEVIEAKWLFGFDADQISVIVHPQSVVHSMVEMVDGSVIAQMGVTDMRHAIQYALTYPERHSCQLPPLDLTAVSGLHFEAPDLERFPCIKLAYRALTEGGTLPAAMNAANEEAVNAFLNERIRLTEIPQVIETVMNDHVNQPAKDIETILEADHQARHAALAAIEDPIRVHP